MRLLAESHEPEELNQKGFSFYCDFRPDIEPGKSGWGKRGKVPCEVILNLRKTNVKGEDVADDANENAKPPPIVEYIPKVEDDSEGGEPRPKKPRIEDSLELDEDELFGD
jgi:hypothetical protein